MKGYLEKYDIPVLQLKDKLYEYDFEDDSRFFACFEHSLVEQAHFTARLQLRKERNMLQLHFFISGSMQLICDRSLDEFDYPFQLERRHIIQLGDKQEFVSDELTILPATTSSINVAHLIYEEIIFAVPMKKLHPRYRQTQEQEGQASELVYTTHTTAEEDAGAAKADDSMMDPRWEALKKLKYNQNENEN